MDFYFLFSIYEFIKKGMAGMVGMVNHHKVSLNQVIVQYITQIL